MGAIQENDYWQDLVEMTLADLRATIRDMKIRMGMGDAVLPRYTEEQRKELDPLWGGDDR